jgi:hypothetical protein
MDFMNYEWILLIYVYQNEKIFLGNDSVKKY